MSSNTWWKWRYGLKVSNTLNKKICYLYLTVTRIFLSVCRGVNKMHLGTRVIYKTREMYLANEMSVASNGKTCWKLRETQPELDDYIIVSEDEFKKVRSIQNLKNDSMAYWRWYLDSWLTLDTWAMDEGRTLSSIRILGKKKARFKF